MSRSICRATPSFPTRGYFSVGFLTRRWLRLGTVPERELIRSSKPLLYRRLRRLVGPLNSPSPRGHDALQFRVPFVLFRERNRARRHSSLSRAENYSCGYFSPTPWPVYLQVHQPFLPLWASPFRSGVITNIFLVMTAGDGENGAAYIYSPLSIDR